MTSVSSVEIPKKGSKTMLNPIIKVRLLRPWNLIDGGIENWKFPSPHHVRVAAGEYELEVVRNPRAGFSNSWLVIKGTKIGKASGAWLQWCNGQISTRGTPIDWDTWEIQVFIDGHRVPPTVERLAQTGHDWYF